MAKVRSAYRIKPEYGSPSSAYGQDTPPFPSLAEAAMFIVFDWNKTKAFGPFDTKDKAEDWLAGQGIRLGQYEDQEVSVMALEPLTATLELI